MGLGCKVNCLQSTASGSTVTHPLLPLPGTLILCRCLLQHGHNPRHQNVAGGQHVSLCCSLARPSTWYSQMLILISAIGNQSIASPLAGGSNNGNVQQGTAVYGFLQRASTLQQKGDEESEVFTQRSPAGRMHSYVESQAALLCLCKTDAKDRSDSQSINILLLNRLRIASHNHHCPQYF